MIINQAGALRKEYFTSYIRLIMNAKECPVDKAKEITFKRLFRNNKENLGASSYQQFVLGYEELKRTLEAS